MKSELRVIYRETTTPMTMDISRAEVDVVITAWLFERWGSRDSRLRFAVHVGNGRVVRGYQRP